MDVVNSQAQCAHTSYVSLYLIIKWNLIWIFKCTDNRFDGVYLKVTGIFNYCFVLHKMIFSKGEKKK